MITDWVGGVVKTNSWLRNILMVPYLLKTIQSVGRLQSSLSTKLAFFDPKQQNYAWNSIDTKIFPTAWWLSYKKARQKLASWAAKSLQKDSVVIKERWPEKSAVIFLFAYDLFTQRHFVFCSLFFRETKNPFKGRKSQMKASFFIFTAIVLS